MASTGDYLPELSIQEFANLGISILRKSILLLSATLALAGPAVAQQPFVGGELRANRGQPNGYAPLDSGAHVPPGNLPAATTGSAGACQYGVTSGTCAQGDNSPFALSINVKDPAYGAKSDAVGLTDATVSANASTLYSPTATFSVSDVGKRLTLSGSGDSGVSQSGTIISFIDSHHVGLSFTTTYATPWYGLFSVSVANGGTNYAVGDLVTLDTSSPVTDAVFKVAAVNAGVVTSLVPSGYGHYPSTPSGTYATTGGSGSDLTVTVAGTTERGGQFTYGTDNGAAFANALTAAENHCGLGGVVSVKIPAGAYYLETLANPLMTCNISIVGDGESQTSLFIDPNFSGDVFAWSDPWLGAGTGAFPFDGPTLPISANMAGPRVEGFRIVGDRTAAGQQNAFMFYDHADWLSLSHLGVYYLHGRALCLACAVKHDAVRYVRESRLDHLRFYSDGLANVPVLELGAGGAGVANDVRGSKIDIYASYGPSFVIRADTGAAIGQDHFDDVRIEGLEWNAPGIAGDLLQIGDASLGGRVVDVYFANLQLIDPYASYCAMRLTGSSQANQPYDIYVLNGSIGGGAAYGKGLCIDAGRNSFFQFGQITTIDTNLTVGATPLTSGGLVLGGAATLANLTTSIDPSAAAFVVAPLNPGLTAAGATVVNLNASSFNMACAPDSTAVCGNSRGFAAADLQPTRVAGTQVASGAHAYLGPGANNTASGSFSAVLNGASSSAQGTYGIVAGGNVVDNGMYGLNCYGSGAIAATGDAQSCYGVLRASASSTSAVQLTSDGNAASNINIVNIPNDGAYTLRIQLVALDKTAPANSYSWVEQQGLLTRGANASLTTYSHGTPTTTSTGTVTGILVSETADTINGGLNLSFTPPTGNSDVWDVVAQVQFVRVQ